jgi:hypothetical protein
MAINALAYSTTVALRELRLRELQRAVAEAIDREDFERVKTLVDDYDKEQDQ